MGLRKFANTGRMITAAVIVGSLLSAPLAHANYAAATQNYQARRYSVAAGLYFQSYSYSKTREEKRASEWFLAQSLQQLGLFYSASKYYSVIVRRGYNDGNPYFRKALEALGNINRTLNLGQSHIVQLFKTKVDPAAIPQAARGFYFYYLGSEQFSRKSYEKAEDFFQRVPAGSPYYVGAQFHLGVIANLSGQHSRAVSLFERVRAGVSPRGKTQGMWEMANLNLARIHYETRKFPMSLQYYREIPRDSDKWLTALWEASWAFFMMQDHNNALGVIHTIHSPFFENRFYPESYILQSITHLRLCRFEQVKSSLKGFKERYQAVFKDVQAMMEQNRGKPKEFFRLVYDYRVGTLRSYQAAFPILDEVSRSDAYKEASDTIRFSTAEANELSRYAGAWKSSGLLDELQNFLSSKKSVAASDAGRRLFDEARTHYETLKDLSDQSGLIQAEMLLGKVDQLRSQLNVGTANKKTIEFIGGLQPLNLADDLEYWPFQPSEYWEDELGYYKYNIESKCSAGKDSK